MGDVADAAKYEAKTKLTLTTADRVTIVTPKDAAMRLTGKMSKLKTINYLPNISSKLLILKIIFWGCRREIFCISL